MDLFVVLDFLRFIHWIRKDSPPTIYPTNSKRIAYPYFISGDHYPVGGHTKGVKKGHFQKQYTQTEWFKES